MTDDQFAEFLLLPYERKNVEFKGPGNLKDQPLQAKVARAAQGMANRRDGGHIILGVNDQNGKLDPVGLSNENAATWTYYDNVRDVLNSYADPPIQFEVEKHSAEGKQFVIIVVHEFEDVPIVCKKHFMDTSTKDPQLKLVLRDGACYIRSRRKNETVEVPSALDMHDLLSIAIEKGVQRFVAQAHSAGISLTEGVQASSEAFAKERNVTWDSPVISKILTRGYWEVSFSPDSYARERIASLPTLVALTDRAQLRYGGWNFPHIEKQRDIVRKATWIEHAYQAMHNLEAWRFFQSGQFIDIAGIPYDWQDESSWWPADRNWQSGQAISIEDIIERCTQTFDFAARLAAAEEYHATSQFFFRIMLHGMKDRVLYISERGKVPLSRIYKAAIEEYPFETFVARDELIAKPRDFALRAAITILNRFSWDPVEATIRSTQDKLTQ